MKELGRVMPREIEVADSLRLRLLEPGYSSRIFQILQQDPDIQCYITWTAGLASPRNVRTAIERFRRQGEARYGIMDNEGLAGYASLQSSVRVGNELDIAYFNAPECRGRGYVTRTVERLMATAEKLLPVKSFALYIEDSNLASQAVAGRLGFYRTAEQINDVVLNCLERRYERPVDAQ